MADARSGPLLFVIQQHSARRMHYDFRLECDGVLKSWAVPKGPSLDPAEKRLAVPTEDHPFDYASFEGVIPPGQYGAGEVIVWDCGVYSPDEDGEPDGSTTARRRSGRCGKGCEGKLSVLLRGEKVKGSFALVRTSRGKDWLLIKHKDRFVSKDDITARNRSVLSGIAVDEMKAMPVQRIAAASLVPTGKRGADAGGPRADAGRARATRRSTRRTGCGSRSSTATALGLHQETQVSLRSRRGLELAKQFPGVAAEIAKQGRA